MQPVGWLKIGFIIFAFCEAFFMGILPVKVNSCRNSISLLGIANAFAGGIFIGIALLHIMPEQVESWADSMCKIWLDDNPGSVKDDCPESYPLPFLLLVTGYTLILVLDKVVFDAHAYLHSKTDGHEDH